MIAMEAEIADQTFGLPSRELARTPSPKTPKPGVEAAGKQPGVISAPQPAKSTESASYPGLVKSLTECVKACHNALDGQDTFPARQERLKPAAEESTHRITGSARRSEERVEGCGFPSDHLHASLVQRKSNANIRSCLGVQPRGKHAPIISSR